MYCIVVTYCYVKKLLKVKIILGIKCYEQNITLRVRLLEGQRWRTSHTPLWPSSNYTS